MARPTCTAVLVLGVFSALWIALLPGDLDARNFTQDDLAYERWGAAYHQHETPDAGVTHRHYPPSNCEVRFLEEDDFWRHGCQRLTGQALAIFDGLQLPDRNQNFAPISILRVAPKQSPPSLIA
jgi:hypothetical protein